MRVGFQPLILVLAVALIAGIAIFAVKMFARKVKPNAVSNHNGTAGFCPNCGGKLNVGAHFCTFCGSTVEAAPGHPISANKNTSSGKPVNKKLIVILSCAAAAMLVLALTLVLIIGNRSNYIFVNPPVQYSEVDGVLTVYYNMNEIASFNDASVLRSIISMDGKVTVFCMRRDDTISLYYIKGGKLKEIGSYNGAINPNEVYINYNGSVVDYLVENNDSSYSYSDLYTYTGGQSKKIAQDVETFIASPNGKTIVYYTYDSGYDYSYIYKNGKIEVFDYPIFAIADNAKYIYYEDADNEYVRKGISGSDLMLCPWPDEIYFNRDMSEAIIYVDDDAYLCKNGEYVTKIAYDFYELIIPNGSYHHPYAIPHVIYLDNIKSFTGCYLSADDVILRIKSNGTAETVVRYYDYYQLSADGNTLFFTQDDILKVVNGKKNNSEIITLAYDVDSFSVADNGKSVYVTNEDCELIYIDLSNGNQQVIERDYYNLINEQNIFNGDSLLYYIDNCLYLANGRNSSKIAVFDDYTEIISAKSYYPNGLMYITLFDNNAGSYIQYCSKNGNDFVLTRIY